MEKPMGWVQPQEGEMGTEAEALRSAMPMELEKGVCYLVKEKKPELSFRLFEMLLAQKIPSLCITRQYPDRVRRERGLTDVRIIWLSHTPGEDYHNPTAIGTLAKVIQKFIEDNNGEGAVLLDGLEYLIINNGFLQTLMFVEHVNEFVMQRRAIILLPVSPDTLEEKELALLEGVGAHGQQDDRPSLHDELVHVFHEHEGLQKSVVDDQVLQAIEEDRAFAVVVLDELLDDLGERADRRRVVIVLPGRVAEPNDPHVRQAALATHAVRILTRDAQARDFLSE